MKIPQNPPLWHAILLTKDNAAFKIIRNPEVSKLISNFNDEHLHWEDVRRRPLPNGIKPEQVWALMKFFRSDKEIVFSFEDITLRYSLLPDTLRKLHLLDLRGAGHIEIEDSHLPTQDRTRFIISSLMEEAIASSQLEGAATTRKIAKEMLKLSRRPRNNSERMIRNGYLTLRMIGTKKKEKLTPQLLLEIQKAITENTLKNKEDEGKFRDNNEIMVGDTIDIGKIYHVPPDYNEIPALIEAFCKFANDDEAEKFIHPVIKGIILHFLIGFIHPFNDGNGRTARAIFYWYVISRGYWLFEYTALSRRILRSRTQYDLAYLYTETDENDLTYFIHYNLDAIMDALKDIEEHIIRKQKEQSLIGQMISRLKDINYRQANILRDVMKGPPEIINISYVENTYNVVYQTARSDLLHLTKLKYLTKRKAGNKFIFMLTPENKEYINRLTLDPHLPHK